MWISREDFDKAVRHSNIAGIIEANRENLSANQAAFEQGAREERDRLSQATVRLAEAEKRGNEQIAAWREALDEAHKIRQAATDRADKCQRALFDVQMHRDELVATVGALSAALQALRGAKKGAPKCR